MQRFVYSHAVRVLLIVTAWVSLLSIPTAHASPCSSIAAVRGRPLGSSVAVIGIVTVQSGAFDTGFAVQQGDAGIYVLDSGSDQYQIGDRVRVDGTLIDANGLLAIQPTETSLLNHARATRPERRFTAAVGERTEGQLLRLHGKMIGALVDDSPYGYKLSLDDGSGEVQVFLYPGTGIATSGLVDGVQLSVVCFSNQYDTHYECDPRASTDLEIIR